MTDPCRRLGRSALCWVVLASCAPAAEDADHDGVHPPEDCDDHDPRVTLGPLWLADADRDGYPDPSSPVRACAAPEGFVPPEGACPSGPRGPAPECPADCDDDDPGVHPDAVEICDGLDQDCDGKADDDARDVVTWYDDADGDGHAGSSGGRSCEVPAGASTLSTDCDDTDGSVFPGATETCDYADEDCDGVVDDGLPVSHWWRDADRDGYGDAAQKLVTCAEPLGFVTNADDCDDHDALEHPGAEWHADADGDGFGAAGALVSCQRPEGLVVDGSDCDDTDPEQHPGVRWGPDADGDGFGSIASALTQCERPTGWLPDPTDCDDTDARLYEYVLVLDDLDDDGFGSTSTYVCGPRDAAVGIGDDCSDYDASVYPGAPELCDRKDNDCDDAIDEDATGFWDADGDGYGDAATERVGYCGVGWMDVGTDCDDTEDDAFPGAPEWCNGRDDDCDGLTDGDDADEASDATWYADGDGDGWGDAAVAVTSCAAPDGYVDDSGDCDDADETISPGAEERCADEIDDDCDGTPACVADAPLLTGEWRPSGGGDGLRDAAIAGLGDVDGDGWDDLLVGSWPAAVAGRTDAGRAWFVPGPLLEEAPIATAGVPIFGADSDTAGYAVAAAGDLDGDGDGDLAIGAPGYGVYGSFGSVWLLSAPTSEADLSSGFAQITGDEWAQVGLAVSGAGDTVGDSGDDFLVGVPGADTYGLNAPGAVALLEGPISGTASYTAGSLLLGVDDRELLGGRVLGGHDFDGDGQPDAVAAGDSGVAVVSGGWSGTVLRTEVASLWTPSSSSSYPLPLAAGDVDDDGVDDLVIGVWPDDEVWVLTDPMAGGSTPTSVLAAEPGGDAGGVAVLDLDGAGAVLVSGVSPSDQCLYLVRDAAAGSLDLGDADATWVSSAPWLDIGEPMASAGDLDGDGVHDAMFGGSWSPAGALFLISGSDL